MDSNSKEGNIKILWRMMRGHRLKYFSAIAVMALGTIVAFGFPQVIRMATDGLIGGGEIAAPAKVAAWLHSLKLGTALAFCGIAIIALTAVGGALQYLRGLWAAQASEAMIRSLRDRLYDRLQRLPLSYHAKADTGDLVQRCTSDVETIRTFLSAHVVEVGRCVIMLAAVLPIMLRMDAVMTVVSLATIPLNIISSYVFFVRVKAYFKLADEAEGRMTTVLQENLTGIRVVRAFARQEFECSRFSEKNAEYRDRTRRMIMLMAIFWCTSDFVCLFQGGTTLIVGGYRAAQGQLTVGTLYAFMTYLFIVLWPVRQMGRILTNFGQAIISLGRIQEILSESTEQDSADAIEAKGKWRGDIVVENLHFTYPGASAPALKDISLHIHAGQTVALLGPTGSGKSTLVRLLARLFDYESGSIQIDGTELREMRRETVRENIGMALQEPFLFSKSVADNIRMARPDADESALIEAASDAAIHEAVMEFEKGYETIVGERGVSLSGGQRQRVSLARTLLRKPPILILDDTLSAVDTRTESVILNALRRRHGQCTTILIAHRLSTLQQADWIVVLDKGRIVQQGRHENLLAEEGLYSSLWRIQGELEEELALEA